MAYKKSERMVERKQARRKRFLDTAIPLFGRLGYHPTTVPMIVGEAQSSTGAFYLYFRNKEDVYAASLEEIGKRLSAALNEAMERGSTPGAQMSAAVEGLVRWLAGNPAEARILMEAKTLGGRLEEARRAIIESHVRSVAAALELAAPSVEAQDRNIVARCWVGAVLEAAMEWLAMPEGNRAEPGHLARVVASFNLRGAEVTAGRQAPP
ncbi:MAG: TetR/AcrR family transcriptional regulator [Bryobacteraceae bacterium]